MYMLHHESHVPVHLHYESHLLPPCNDKAHRFSHYFENIGEIAAAASTTSMTSPDQVAAPRQNHREGTGSRASKPLIGCDIAKGATACATFPEPSVF
jgi:hypothetical protein